MLSTILKRSRWSIYGAVRTDCGWWRSRRLYGSHSRRAVGLKGGLYRSRITPGWDLLARGLHSEQGVAGIERKIRGNQVEAVGAWRKSCRCTARFGDAALA